ncbi:MAG TPA: hypothetical protein VMQ65_06535 [Candidatus Limnocylindria bacterium]|nr:hypothetical protein [Candidatus Limnocylindria bacterium]
MQGFIRAIARLFAMGLVMAAVLVASVFAGLATTTAIALGLVGAGVVGIVLVARRPRASRLSAADEIAAMMAPAPAPATAAVARPGLGTTLEVMAPQVDAVVNPEANMPRWRRPSLLEARHSDPTRQAPVRRLPMRFTGTDTGEVDVRVVRYAMVPVLDRPDEVLGMQVGGLSSGDEVQVVGGSGAFIEVLCPNGDQGWVHRTTLGQRGGLGLSGNASLPVPQEADDALTALLSARGLI